ncbi:MAG: beta-galactosidase [Defluviitaleaceae bacterium]|nr:beta-galactosidase [Defluviitaleaceae bacterium]
MFSYDSCCLYKDGKPWFPFMGEIHYSRLPKNEWRDELLKMKAGGITVIASYNFWIHHEEIKGQWDFDGCKDLKTFVETVKDCGLYMFLRIGPWSHGEARNGGFPDWLMTDGCTIRTDDPAYLAYVKAFYTKLYEQVDGLFFKDGGPIIGVQIENEYGHCGGLSGEAGEAHMRTLTKIAKDIGFDAPIYTATGWNGAVTGGLLPVMGGYPDAPWDQTINELEPSGNYVFSYERNDTSIGSDLGVGAALSYDTSKFPYLTAELGGGLQVTRLRRTVPSAQDIAAMSIAKLGSGCNLLGYYMYHGGVNPEGKLTTLQESKDSGGYCDLPELSYDFSAPLGSYGQYQFAYHELRLLGMFVADFGESLCTMPALIPADNPGNPSDRSRFRYSFRHNDGWGYVFFNNHVRHMMRPRYSQVTVTVPGMDLQLPTFDIAPGQFGFYPFNMPVNGGIIKFAEATPLCMINGTTVLYGTSMDATGDVLLVSKEEALCAYKITGDKERLIISNNPLIQDGDEIHFFATEDLQVKAYPAWDSTPDGFEYKGMDGVFGVYEKRILKSQASCQVTPISSTRYKLNFNNLDPNHDYGCIVKYTANTAKAYIDGRMVIDDFYRTGQWYIGLGRHNFPKTIEIELEPLYADTQVYLEAWPPMKDDSVCRIDGVEIIAINRVVVK